MCRAANNILCLCYELPATTPLQAYDIGPIDLSICGRNLLSVSSSPRNHSPRHAITIHIEYSILTGELPSTHLRVVNMQ